MPEHLGIIVDGNRRWATARGVDLGTAYHHGARKAIDVLTWCEERGIANVTLWLLSLANFDRDHEQLRPLLHSIAQGVPALAATRRWRLRAIGRVDAVPPFLADALRTAERKTASASGMRVNLAVAYGGRHEIVSVAQGLAAEGQPITEQAISDGMAALGQTEPDLIIRTAGEQRLSGFLLWQAIHTELYFCRAPWPSLRRRHIARALSVYAQRTRTYGA